MNDIRTKCLSQLIIILDDKVKTAINVEKSIYNDVLSLANKKNIEKSWDEKRFQNLYIQRYIDINLNLSNPENDFKEKILRKEIMSKDVAKLSYEHIYPDKYKPVEFIDNNIDDGIFLCYKCKSRKTTYYSLQTRSSDEPMTNFITCMNCNNKWKM